jgi:hypothetical protein
VQWILPTFFFEEGGKILELGEEENKLGFFF